MLQLVGIYSSFTISAVTKKAADVVSVMQSIPPKQKKFGLVQIMQTWILFCSSLGSSCPTGKIPRAVEKQSHSLLSMSVWPAGVLQAACFFWVIQEQGLTAPVVSPVQIKVMIFALIGSSLQAYISIFSYLTTPHDPKAELTGFWKNSVKHCHTSLAWPGIRRQQLIGWYWKVMRHELF